MRRRWHGDHRAKLSNAAALGVILFGAAWGACGTREQAETRAREERRGTLSGGAAAQVGGELIAVESVRKTAEAQGIGLEDARSKLVSDAVFAAGARADGWERQPSVEAARRGLLARALLERLREESSTAPISDDEVARFTAMHWLDLDRPEARECVHAVVTVKQDAEPKERKRAMDLAQGIARAVEGETDPARFQEKAKAVGTDGFEVVVQPLPPVTRDGRVADLKDRPPPGVPTPTFDPTFVAGLFEVPAPGEQSRPFWSSFGAHVVLLTRIQPAKQIPLEDRRLQLAPEIKASRAKATLDALVESLRGQTAVRVERNAEALLELVPAGRTGEGP